MMVHACIIMTRLAMIGVVIVGVIVIDRVISVGSMGVYFRINMSIAITHAIVMVMDIISSSHRRNISVRIVVMVMVMDAMRIRDMILVARTSIVVIIRIAGILLMLSNIILIMSNRISSLHMSLMMIGSVCSRLCVCHEYASYYSLYH